MRHVSELSVGVAFALTIGVVGCGDDAGGDGSDGSGAQSTGGAGSGASSTGATGAGGAPNGGSGTGGSGGGAPAGKVAMFVAQGHMGMTVVSCDDGQSWTGYRTFETEASPLLCGNTDQVDCFDGPCSFMDGNGQCEQATTCDCDHSPGSGKGLAFGDGAFVATFGWGPPGVVLRSTNGVDWTEVDSGHTYADAVAGNGYLALSARSPMVSTDGGLTFVETTDANHNPWNVRRLFYFADSQVFMQTAASGDNRDLRITSDWMSWSEPSGPGECVDVSEAIEGAGVVVTAANGNSFVCVSSDGASSFARVDLPGGADIFSGPIWDGSQFIVWGTDGGMKAYTSADGQVWSAADTNLGNVRFGEVARNPETGTMVAARDQWQAWYQDMQWYRSSDGVTWETLSPGASVLSHPVNEMTFGYGDPSDVCPGD